MANAIVPISLRFDYSSFSGAWHLVYYIPNRNQSEKFSKSLINFKGNDKATVDKWIALVVEKFGKVNVKIDYVVRALRSSEKKASGNEPLDRLGKALADSIEAEYVPLGIKKTRTTKPMHNFRKKADREEELRDVYFVDSAINIENEKNFLIIDDINTSGTTVKAIRKAIREKHPNSKIYFLTLGRTTDRDENGAYITTVNDEFDSTFLN